MPVLKSRIFDVEIPDDVSAADFVFRDVEKCKDKPAIKDDTTGEEITYGSLAEKINRLSYALSERGIKKGDVVCLFADKSITGTIVVFSLMKTGAIMTPCRPSHTAGELFTQMRDSGSSFLIADEKLMKTATEAVKKTEATKAVFCIGEAKEYESVQDLINSTDPTATLDVKIDPKKDLATIIFSSGTTGLPKGCMITHYALVANTMMGSDPRVLENWDDVIFQMMPPFHIAGIALSMEFLYLRRLVVLLTTTSLMSYLRKVKEYKVKFVTMLPSNLVQLSKHPKEEIDNLGLDFSELIVLTGGSKLDPTNTRDLIAVTGVKAVVQAYGSTENGFVSSDHADSYVPGSVGTIAPNLLVKIADMNTGKTLGPNQPGEICVKGPATTIGYLNNPEATKEVFDDEGFFRMGDVGYYDETEHLFIIDRIKDVIKYQTMQVSPSEIEEVIYSHPAVLKASVIPIKDDNAGEVPLACIILKDGHSATEEEIVKLVEDNVADYKRLRGGVRFMKEFPLTSLGKIIKRELRDQVQADIK